MRAEMAAPVLALALLLGGCDMFGLGPCPEPPERALESGTFRTAGPPVPNADRDPAFAHAGSGAKTMTIDRAAETVEIRYERGGKQVREVWRVRSSSYELH